MKKLLYTVSTIGIGEEIKKKIEKEIFKKFNCIEIKNDLNGYNKKFNYKLIAGFFKRLNLKKNLENYHNKIIKNITEDIKNIDYFLSIGNLKFNKLFLDEVRKNNPQIKMILFLWDKIEYLPKDRIKNIDYFDFVYTYDKEDAKKYGYIFRPTFYIEEDNTPWTDKELELYYIGALRESKRYEYISKVKEYLKNNNLKYYIKIFVDKELRKNLPKIYDKDIIITKRFTYAENINILKRSKVVLDIGYGNQKGLSLRPYESLGMNLKLITDNEKIKEYEFYNEENIKIIKSLEDIVKIEMSFFEKPYVNVDKRIKEKYSIKEFLKEIFSNC